MAPDVGAFRDLLFAGRSAVTEIPQTRWRHAPYFHPVPGTPGRCYSFAAGVVEGIDSFDPAPFGISPREAQYMDPQQRMFLQVVWEALEDACLKPSDLAGKDVGVFAGASLMDFGAGMGHDPQAADSYVMSGSSLAVIANRVSHVFDWHGPSMTIDTACSSSLFALKAALKALRSGEVEVAVVGATNALLLPAQFVGFAAARMLSPTGRCQAFGRGADGYVRGEGAVAFVLVRDEPGRLISPRDHGRLLHVETNTSGRTVNIALPSSAAQQALLRAAYETAGVDPEDLAFVEAHGTGTAVGDPAEAEALGLALGRRRGKPLAIGSVKSNIGHLEPAAGSAGLLKALIALEEGRLPPSLNAADPNPDIPFDRLNLSVATQPRSLAGEGRLAGVSSFGFGGANAHAILAAPEPKPVPVVETGPEEVRRIHVASAFCREALRAELEEQGARLFDAGGRQNARLIDEALHFRDLKPQRAVLCAADPLQVRAALDAFAGDRPHPALETGMSRLTEAPVVFLFSGNGGQYPGMSLAAYAGNALYRAAYDRIDAAWTAHAGWSLREMLQSATLAEEITRAPVSQPLLFADQSAMAAALVGSGVTPSAVLGHSAGEVAAAHACGALDLAQAVRLIEARSHVQERLAGQGTMAALQVAREEAEEILLDYGDPEIEIAAINSPRSVSLVGPREALDAFSRHARKHLRLACVPIRVNYPFHSSRQDPLRDTLLDRLGVLRPEAGTIRFQSGVTGGRVAGGDLDSVYWWRNMREPVQFEPALRALLAEAPRVFIELGPDPVLTGYARDTLKAAGGESAVTHAQSRRDGADPDPVTRALARLLVAGGAVDAAALAPHPAGPSRELRHYPWQNRRLSAADTPRLRREAGQEDYHPLLGIDSGAEALDWRTEMDLHLQAAFADHTLGGRCLLPGTGLAEMALAAAQRALGQQAVSLLDFDMTSALALMPRNISEVRTEVDPAERRVRISSRARWSGEAWRLHGAGRIARLLPAEEAEEAPSLDRGAGDLPAALLYAQAREVGLTYGEGFRNLSHYRQPAEDEIEVVLRADRPGGYDAGDHALDPIGADAVLHGLVAALQDGRFADLSLAFLPTRIGQLDLLHPGALLRSGRIRLVRKGERSLRADLTVFDGEGRAVARLRALDLRAARLVQPVDFATHAFGMEQVQLAAPWQDPVEEGLPELAERVLAERVLAGAGDPQAEGEEPGLILDALAQRIAFDAVQQLPRGADGESREPGPNPALSAALLRLLEGAGLARQGETDWQVEERPWLPDWTELVAGLSEEQPQLIAECAALSCLAEALPDLVRRETLPEEEAVLGRATLEALDQGSAFAHARAQLVAERARVALAAIRADANRPLRILEVATGGPSVLALMSDSGAEPWRLEEEAAQMVPPSVAGGIGRLAPRHLEELGPVDLILGCGTARQAVVTAPRLAALQGALVSGGLLLLAEQAPRPHVTLLRLIRDLSLREGAVNVPPLQDLEGLREAALAAGADAPVLCTVAAGCGTTLLALQTPSRDAAGAAPRCGPHLPDPLALSLGAALSAADGEAFERIDGAATILVAPPRAEAVAQEVLKDRILTLAGLLKQAEEVGPQRIWVILPDATGPAPDPAQAALWSVLRTARNEHPALQIHAIDPGDADDDQSAARLATVIAGPTPETELRIENGALFALRVRQGGDRAPQTAGVVRLTPDPAGGLDRMSWTPAEQDPPARGQVRLEVEAAGLNYRDVMWSMGLLPEEALEGGFAGPTLGLECAGRVVALGEGVDSCRIGDRVVAFGGHCLSSHVTVDALHIAPVPEEMPPEAAATLPTAFFTAYYALHHLGRMRQGDRVLIHGGAGGVGLAAIQIARWAGARVVATAGTPAKRAFLRALGVETVLSSRELSFAEEIRATLGGVDIVLNSLAGEAMERSLSLLRPFGRFLELGKVDFYANTGIGLRPLRENIAYHGIDVDRLLAHDPLLAQGLFAEVMQLFRAGELVPLPWRAFRGEEAEEAFRLMQRSGHIGKVVLTPPAMPRAARDAVPPIFRCSDQGVHLVAGGGGGLGLELADRLARNGARKVAVLGRSDGPGAEAEAVIRAASERGAEIRYVCCDIADADALDATLGQLRGWGPIELVINSAMVLRDRRLEDLTRAELDAVMAPKVAGTANLDRATRADPLRQFVVFTSMATLIGNHGQAAYVAANAWAEALVRRRRQAGLPALATGWGAISDCGYLTRDAEVAQFLRRFAGGVDFGVRTALRALDQLMAPEQQIVENPVLWVSPMSWAGPVASLAALRGPTFGVLRALGQCSGEARQGDDLREQVLLLEEEAAQAHLAGFLKREIARILRVPESALPEDRPVSDLGVDSLMGVELGLAAQQALGEDIPLMAISDALSIREIAARIATHIRGGEQAPGAVAPAAPAARKGLADLAAQHLAPPPVRRSGLSDDDKMEAAE